MAQVVVKTCPFSGEEVKMKTGASTDQLIKWQIRSQTGEGLHDIFSNLPMAERIFIAMGITKENMDARCGAGSYDKVFRSR